MVMNPLTPYDRRKSRLLTLLCFKNTDPQRKSVVLSSDFVVASQIHYRLPSIVYTMGSKIVCISEIIGSTSLKENFIHDYWV